MPFTHGTSHVSTGPSVPRAEDEQPGSEFAPGEKIGAFHGRLVRPKASRPGLTAQVFGENGPDADTIIATGLSHYVNVPVQVQMVMIKDGDGRLLKKNGEFPRFKPFMAKMKRPAAHSDGMIAQLFAENGPDADIVSALNETRYLDNLVYVVILKSAGKSVPVSIDGQDLEEAAKRRTPAEEKGLKVQQKLAREGWRQLTQAGFFRKDPVLRVLGSTEQFREWVLTQRCCHPGEAPCQNGDIQAFMIPNPGLRLRHVPLCHAHAALWETGAVVLPNNTSPETFLLGEQARLVHQWAQVRFRELLQVPAGHDPTPSSVYRFCVDHHLLNALPAGFAALLETGSS